MFKVGARASKQGEEPTPFVMKINEGITIPSLPTTISRLREALTDVGVSISEVAEIVAQDPPIAAKVLRFANSALYAPREPIKTVQHGAAILGMAAIEQLVLQAALVETFAAETQRERFDAEALWRHSILVGHVSQAIAKRSTARHLPPLGQLYTAGLLHDIGKFVLLGSQETQYLALLDDAQAKNQQAYLAEKEHLGFTHADVGKALAESWQFPESTCEAIGLHHEPRVRIQSNGALVVVLADHVARFVDRAERDPDILLWRQLGLSSKHASDVVDFARSCLASIDV